MMRMKRRAPWLALLALGLGGAAPMAAQTGAANTRSGAVRQAVEVRFAERVSDDLELSDAQAAKLRASVARWAGERRRLAARERDLRRTLAGQLRPGDAADEDKVADLSEELLDLRVKYAETFRDEMHDLRGVLDPVQRARFFAIRERLLQRVQELRQDRRAGAAAGGTAPRRTRVRR
ncbi:MAG TPA: Spy/CpxP family protein refolding chaperone [Gemmatimonadales bacterium]|nr:Spy/CpxP family protein refolding chaperone [Gemmatimonadales bacterium]